jgi:ribosomal protein L29
MKYSELEKKKELDLQKLLKDKREAYKSFRFGMSGTKTRNVKEGMGFRKDIARVLTEINKRRHELK